MTEADPGVAAAAVVHLRCSVQSYDWGIRGEKSTVARLFAKNSGREIEGDRPYAELWMGTHGSGPSFVVGAGGEKTLKQWVKENPGVLGDRVAGRWGNDLPFLFKVLSVAKALSIQAHPDKALAKVLNKMHPDIYKDQNHKPEMAIAITEFKALCGFISIKELKDVLNNVPEIKELVGLDEASRFMDVKEEDRNERVKTILQSIFTKLMSADKDTVAELVSKLKRRLNEESKIRKLNEKEELALLLEKQYPADIGVISSFFFNYVKLNPGEGLYIGANEPHAYVSGECIECMATSDNVVRAGLTPKYRDVGTLCSMLTYKQGFPEILRGIPLKPHISRYTTPFDEFEVDDCMLLPGEFVVYSAIPGPSLFIVLAGQGKLQTGLKSEDTVIKEGHVFFVSADVEIKISADAAGKMRLYRAGVNSKLFG